MLFLIFVWCELLCLKVDISQIRPVWCLVMASKNVYKVTEHTLKYLSARCGDSLFCCVCREPIKEGDIVRHTYRRSRQGRGKFYHVECLDAISY
jgi:hypothetical protein